MMYMGLPKHTIKGKSMVSVSERVSRPALLDLLLLLVLVDLPVDLLTKINGLVFVHVTMPI